MEKLGEKIYEYQFSMLFMRVKNLIGRETITVYETKEEEQENKELDAIIGESNLLFDVSGSDFKWLKACDSEYKYWVEVYVLKIIKNLFITYGKKFEEKYFPDSKEQYSIVYELDGKCIEAFFLFDIEDEDTIRTGYDKIADNLRAKSKNVDKIQIYIFRDHISSVTLASLINGNKEFNADGFVEVYPLCDFFEKLFGMEEYLTFLRYANDFCVKCNGIISYKTIITPTTKTLSAFRKKKCQMLRDLDYLKIARKGKSGYLSDKEFALVKNSFMSKRMYVAMVSTNDFADSFISAEWSYDVYRNSMGELELTGIVAGYLKSIEQLMYRIARFHRGQGIEIRLKDGYYEPYTSDNEKIIDSTLWSLNDFVTSSQGKLALSNRIRGCIHKAVDLWRQYQRNGYFHKDNLYKADNKIKEVRELTLYLYFLILGGISFTSNELQSLGIADLSNKDGLVFDFEKEYLRFGEWLDNVFAYDLPKVVPGIWILPTYDKGFWTVHPYPMKHFSFYEFENGSYQFGSDDIEFNHVLSIPSFTWREGKNQIEAIEHFCGLLKKYKEEHLDNANRIQAIIIEADRHIQLIHFIGVCDSEEDNEREW